ncbi:hypothetical protein GCM10027073_60200 [Streptomyces chlorus]
MPDVFPVVRSAKRPHLKAGFAPPGGHREERAVTPFLLPRKDSHQPPATEPKEPALTAHAVTRERAGAPGAVPAARELCRCS